MSANAITLFEQHLEPEQKSQFPILNDLLFKVSIPGRCAIKADTYKMREGNQVQTKEFMQWMTRAQTHIAIAKVEHKFTMPIEEPVFLRSIYYFDNRQFDKPISRYKEVCDEALLSSSIVKDLKIITGSFDQKFFGHVARTEIELWRVRP